jgi:hypothetical protein
MHATPADLLVLLLCSKKRWLPDSLITSPEYFQICWESGKIPLLLRMNLHNFLEGDDSQLHFGSTIKMWKVVVVAVLLLLDSSFSRQTTFLHFVSLVLLKYENFV